LISFGRIFDERGGEKILIKFSQIFFFQNKKKAFSRKNEIKKKFFIKLNSITKQEILFFIMFNLMKYNEELEQLANL